MFNTFFVPPHSFRPRNLQKSAKSWLFLLICFSSAAVIESVNTMTRKRALHLLFRIASNNVPTAPVNNWYLKSSMSSLISQLNYSFTKVSMRSCLLADALETSLPIVLPKGSVTLDSIPATKSFPIISKS